MISTRLRATASLVLAVTAVSVVTALLRRRRRRRSSVFAAAPAPVAPPRTRLGHPARGSGPSYGLDVERLKGESGFEPVVQYLTYIQSQRGDDAHLLFVRYDDLDAMASLDGELTPAFLERLDQLGVVVSTN